MSAVKAQFSLANWNFQSSGFTLTVTWPGLWSGKILEHQLLQGQDAFQSTFHLLPLPSCTFQFLFSADWLSDILPPARSAPELLLLQHTNWKSILKKVFQDEKVVHDNPVSCSTLISQCISSSERTAREHELLYPQESPKPKVSWLIQFAHPLKPNSKKSVLLYWEEEEEAGRKRAPKYCYGMK